jgi:hypothetical protein
MKCYTVLSSPEIIIFGLCHGTAEYCISQNDPLLCQEKTPLRLQQLHAQKGVSHPSKVSLAQCNSILPVCVVPFKFHPGALLEGPMYNL